MEEDIREVECEDGGSVKKIVGKWGRCWSSALQQHTTESMVKLIFAAWSGTGEGKVGCHDRELVLVTKISLRSVEGEFG